MRAEHAAHKGHQGSGGLPASGWTLTGGVLIAAGLAAPRDVEAGGVGAAGFSRAIA